MRVGIVLHPFGNSSKGLEQYVLETTRAILSAPTALVEFVVFVKGKPDTGGLPSGTTVVQLPDTFFWKWSLFSWRERIDTFIFFTEASPIFLWKKSIIVFLDAAYYYFGGSTFLAHIKKHMLVFWRRCMLRASQHVVAISEASKQDLVSKFRILGEHVTVIYPGFKSLTSSHNQLRTDTGNPYFLYVGPIKERKNVVAIIEAFERFKNTTGLPHELLLVGRKTQGVYEDKVSTLIAQSPYKDSIHHKSSVTDHELQSLYTHAEALVFPSILEGFGLPILEALSQGCMVITSSTTSTKEVVGDAGLLVDPQNIDEIAKQMDLVARREYDRDAFIEKAALQCAKFSWSKSGQEWGKVLHTHAEK